MDAMRELNLQFGFGVFRIETVSGAVYFASRASTSDAWWVKRLPLADAAPLWLDLGGPVARFECRVGEPARFETEGGSASSELTAVSSPVVAIRELPVELNAAEVAFLRDYGGVDIDELTDDTEYEAAVESYRQLVKETRPVTVKELGEILRVSGASFAWRGEEGLALVMSTPQEDLADGEGVWLTPWAWLAAGYDRGEVLIVLENDIEW
ncbi:hypothetical protein [Cryobacterium sp. Y29]|uniref:hypothetical protein n=1 Tax=Cryobacterium sp. Y29 TaxID=2048285 RepID=UPI000CE5274F|nr:hypothetical protein [Cryobacterium sp. Y29]